MSSTRAIGGPSPYMPCSSVPRLRASSGLISCSGFMPPSAICPSSCCRRLIQRHRWTSWCAAAPDPVDGDYDRDHSRHPAECICQRPDGGSGGARPTATTPDRPAATAPDRRRPRGACRGRRPRRPGRSRGATGSPREGVGTVSGNGTEQTGARTVHAASGDPHPGGGPGPQRGAAAALVPGGAGARERPGRRPGPRRGRAGRLHRPQRRHRGRVAGGPHPDGPAPQRRARARRRRPLGPGRGSPTRTPRRSGSPTPTPTPRSPSTG